VKIFEQLSQSKDKEYFNNAAKKLKNYSRTAKKDGYSSKFIDQAYEKANSLTK